MARTIVLLGPPGSGKGTQAERLRRRDGFVTLSTGDLLREAREADSELGRRAAEFMRRGELVPDEVIVETMREAVGRHGGAPILLDGFPRTVAQAEALDGILAPAGRELSAVVLIDVDDGEVVERISHRGQGRDDDRPETVKERLRVYHGQTEPLVAFFDSRGLLRRVDGAQPPDAVEVEVRAALE